MVSIVLLIIKSLHLIVKVLSDISYFIYFDAEFHCFSLAITLSTTMQISVSR